METAIGYSDGNNGMRGELYEREQDFAVLYEELIEEAGRALEAGEEAWCAVLQEVFIPSVEPRGLRALAALGGSDA